MTPYKCFPPNSHLLTFRTFAGSFQGFPQNYGLLIFEQPQNRSEVRDHIWNNPGRNNNIRETKMNHYYVNMTQ